MAVEAKGKSEKICLVRLVAETIIGEIRDVVGLQIENGERLLLARRVGTVPAMKEDGEFLVGRENGVGGKVVDWARMARGFGEHTAIRQMDGRLLCGKRRSE